MKVKIKSFKEMKECGELKTNSPEEQEYTRLKRQQLTGEGCAKKESASDYRVGERVDYDGDTFEVIEIDEEYDQVLIENMDGDNSFWVYASELDEEFDESKKKSKKESFVRGYRSQDGDYAQASCNEDGTDCDVTFFGNDEDENPDEIIDEKHFDTIQDAETYLKDEGFHDIRESVKKESFEDLDTQEKIIKKIDEIDNKLKELHNQGDFDSDIVAHLMQDKNYLMNKSSKMAGDKQECAKKESGMTIDDYRIGEWVDWDGDSWTIISKDEELDQVELENKDGDNTVWVDVDELDTLEESTKKEASNGFDIRSIKDGQGNPRYYIEGPDGDIKDDLGQVLYFSSREDAEDYIDTMLLN